MCVRARVYMHVCVSVNMESTTYRIHLAYQMLITYRDKVPHHLCVCAGVCVCVHACVCVHQHGVYHLSYPPSLTKC